MGYGRSIKLDDARDFEFDPATNTFKMVVDVDNLTQSILILLKTMQGEIKFYPEFGIDIPQLLDKTIADDNIKHSISNAITRDPRIKSVDKMELVREQRTLNISMTVTTYDGANLDIRDKMMW